MPLTLGKAAIEVGKSKPTILKALQTGRLSGLKVGNEWQIEPAELFRVYPKMTAVNDKVSSLVNEQVYPRLTTENALEIAVLQAKLEAAMKQIDDLKEDRDQWRVTANRLLSSPPTPASRVGFLAGLLGRRKN